MRLGVWALRSKGETRFDGERAAMVQRTFYVAPWYKNGCRDRLKVKIFSNAKAIEIPLTSIDDILKSDISWMK